MRRFLLTCLAISLVACGGESTSAPPPPKPTISGTWTGVTGPQPVSLTLLESNGTVNGSGTISNTPTGVRALSITGIFNPDGVHFSLTLSSGTAQPVNYTGTYNGVKQLVGTFVGSGFTGETVILNKQ